MQVCTLLQTDNHASTSPLSFFTGRIPVAVWQPCELLYTCYLLTYFLPPSQQCQCTEGTGAYVGENNVFIPPLMEERSIVVTVSVCLSVCLRAYLRNYKWETQ